MQPNRCPVDAASASASAGDVMAAQERLRGLRRANALVASELSLPVVLRQVVEAARGLPGAQYAALGVLARDGGLEQFVHVGMDDELVKKVGDLPRGRGILGLLISEPVPIRLADLAAAAGRAITNARRFTESKQRRRWLAASSDLTPLLLSAGVAKPHMLTTQRAAAAAAADFATLAVPHGADQVIVKGVSGALAANLMNRTALLADSLAGQAILTGKPSLVNGSHREAAAALGTGAGSLMVVPLAAGEHIRGALILGRLTGLGFTETELDVAASSAATPLSRWNSPRPARIRSRWPRWRTTTASRPTCMTISSENCSLSA
jgi:hypothetical protein